MEAGSEGEGSRWACGWVGGCARGRSHGRGSEKGGKKKHKVSKCAPALRWCDTEMFVLKGWPFILQS